MTAIPTADSSANHNSLEPNDWKTFRELGHRMFDDMFDYLESVRSRPVWQPVPDSIRRKLHSEIPLSGMTPEAAYEDFLECVLPYPRGNIHPRYWGWVNGSGIPLAMIADFLASAMNSSVGAFETSSVMVEEEVIHWFLQAFNWSKEGAGGVLTSGCSMAHIIALATARSANVEFDVRQTGLWDCPRLIVYSSSEAHSSVRRAVELLGMGGDSLRSIPVDGNFQLQLHELKKAVNADRTAGFMPLCVVANAGTVSTGAIDPLREIAEFCHSERLWLHVDGAFGGFAWLSPEHRHLLEGMNQADSMALDMHKWLYMPFDVGCLLVKDYRTLESAFQGSAAYISKTESGPASYPISFPNRSIELSRRFRALKVWLSLKAYGFSAFADAIKENIGQAQYFSELIKASDYFELCSNSPLNVVCFRYIPQNKNHINKANYFNRQILSKLQTQGLAVPSHTLIGEKFVLRIANTNHRTTLADMDYLYETTLKIAQALEREIINDS